MTKDKKEITSGDVLEVLQNFIQMTSERFDRVERDMATKADMSILEKKIERVERKVDNIADSLYERMKKQENGLEVLRERIKTLGTRLPLAE